MKNIWEYNMEIGISTDRYVCYNETGQIEKIARRPDNNLDSIKVQYEDVKDLLEGKQSIVNYKVEYDFLEKKYVLKSMEQWRSDQLITAFIYELPTEKNNNYEICVVQNKTDKCWELKINQEFIDNLHQQNVTFNPVEQQFSITKKYDPNVLYRVLKFKNNNTIPFEMDFEFDNEEVSVYTIRKFSAYVHEVI
jgi:hypothetical protein